MRKKKPSKVLCWISGCGLVFAILLGGAYAPIVLTKYEHDKFKTTPTDIVKTFRAYTVSFDGDDDRYCSGNPEWVSYQINKIDKPLEKGPKRPSSWMTDKPLAKKHIAPKDNSYRNSGYDRGHMCMKQIAWRLGKDADWNTHTTLNASPQLHKFNAGIWLDMEYKTQLWADKYGKVWVICGPIFYLDKPRVHIGDAGEKQIAVPDAFFKIVIRQEGPDIKVLSFIYPHEEIAKGKDGKYDHAAYLTSINAVEDVTGLDFLKYVLCYYEDDIAKKIW